MKTRQQGHSLIAAFAVLAALTAPDGAARADNNPDPCPSSVDARTPCGSRH
jgi:hypothetical protein